MEHELLQAVGANDLQEQFNASGKLKKAIKKAIVAPVKVIAPKKVAQAQAKKAPAPAPKPVTTVAPAPAKKTTAIGRLFGNMGKGKQKPMNVPTSQTGGVIAPKPKPAPTPVAPSPSGTGGMKSEIVEPTPNQTPIDPTTVKPTDIKPEGTGTPATDTPAPAPTGGGGGGGGGEQPQPEQAGEQGAEEAWYMNKMYWGIGAGVLAIVGFFAWKKFGGKAKVA